MKMSLLICTAFIVMCFSGCFFVNFTEINPVNIKGSPESYTINVDRYNGIRIEGNFEIRYYSAPSNSVTLEVHPNLREFITLEVVNGELIAGTTRKVFSKRSTFPVLTISTPSLNRLSINGACIFTAYDKIISEAFAVKLFGACSGKAELEVKKLNADLSGTGQLELSGSADTADLFLEGTGEIKALSLQTRETNVNLSGVGAIRINCSGNLQINADGNGTVEYRGSPNINQKTNGMVNIKRAN